MARHLSLNALGLEFVGKAIHAGREHAKPASQQEDARFTGKGRAATQQRDGGCEEPYAESGTKCMVMVLRAGRRKCAAVSAPDSCKHLSNCPLLRDS